MSLVTVLTYSVPEAADALGVSEATVRLLVRRGELPAMHFGRRVRISKAELAEWVSKHKNERFAGRGE